jgi:uncharacterized membrane protein YhaH (DUF805 family)
MTFMKAIARCMENAVSFSGRASRSEFWWCTSAMACLILGFQIFGHVAFDAGLLTVTAPMLLLIAVLATPWAAVAYRRMHDIGLPGWPAIVPLTMNLLWLPVFVLMYVVGFETRSASDLQLAVAQLLLLLLYIMPFVAIAAWIVLAFVLARPGATGANVFGNPPPR